MHAEVFITAQSVPEKETGTHVVVAIDVLRACSTIVTALCRGARGVVPVPDLDHAAKIASNLDPSSYLLGGERGGYRIDQYHCGNSPLEYTREVVRGRTVILSTTNGTVAMHKGRKAERLLVGCFLNIDRVVEAVCASGRDLIIICSGQKGQVSLEDTLCAGYLLDKLWNGARPAGVSDATRMAFALYDSHRHCLDATLREGAHAQWLASKGFGEDVDYCFRFNALPVLPRYRDNRIVLDKKELSRIAA